MLLFQTVFFYFTSFIIILFYFSTEEDSEVQGAAATTSENEVENDDDEENETITRFDENQLPPIDLGKKHALKKYTLFSLLYGLLLLENGSKISSINPIVF